ALPGASPSRWAARPPRAGRAQTRTLAVALPPRPVARIAYSPDGAVPPKTASYMPYRSAVTVYSTRYAAPSISTVTAAPGANPEALQRTPSADGRTAMRA